MSDILKQFANDKEAQEVLKDPVLLNQVLTIIQEATDTYMNDVQKKLSDPRRTIQEKAEDALNIAQAIISAEKKLRELEFYNIIGLKSRGMSHITDV